MAAWLPAARLTASSRFVDYAPCACCKSRSDRAGSGRHASRPDGLVSFMWALWVLVIAGLLTGTLAVAVKAWSVLLARRGKSGTEYVAMALRPLFALYPVLLLGGTASAFALAVHSAGTGRAAMFGLAGVMAAWCGLMVISSTAGFVRARTERHESAQTLGRMRCLSSSDRALSRA